MLKVPPVQTTTVSPTILVDCVLLRSASVKLIEPVLLSAPDPSVIAAVTTPGVITGVSLVPTMVTVTVELSAAEPPEE